MRLHQILSVIIIFVTSTIADEVEIEVQDDFGAIRSSELERGSTYTWKFKGLPTLQTLIVFNITRMEYMGGSDLKIYDDSIIPQHGKTMCMVYTVQGQDQRNECFMLWRDKYGSCILNSVSTECSVWFRRTLSTPQDLVMEYRVLDCSSEFASTVQTTTGISEEGDITDRHLQPTTPLSADADNPGSDTSDTPINLELTLQIAFAVIIVAVIAVIVGFCVDRRRKALANSKVDEEDEHMYEEIDSPRLERIQIAESHYNHLQGHEDPEPKSDRSTDMQTRAYDSSNVTKKKHKDRHVVDLVLVLPLNKDANPQDSSNQ